MRRFFFVLWFGGIPFFRSMNKFSGVVCANSSMRSFCHSGGIQNA